jgi:hypothetical protein
MFVLYNLSQSKQERRQTWVKGCISMAGLKRRKLCLRCKAVEVGNGFVSAQLRIWISILRTTVPLAQLVMSEVPGVDNNKGDTKNRLTSLDLDDRWRHWKLCSRRKKQRWRRG